MLADLSVFTVYTRVFVQVRLIVCPIVFAHACEFLLCATVCMYICVYVLCVHVCQHALWARIFLCVHVFANV
jgi:hypothetical protein